MSKTDEEILNDFKNSKLIIITNSSRPVKKCIISSHAIDTWLEPYIGMDFVILQEQKKRVKVQWWEHEEWVLKIYIV